MLRLRDIMTTDVVTVTPDATLRDVMELFARRHISGAPVVQGGRVVGVISASDVVGFAGTLPGVPTERHGQEEWGEWDQTEESEAEVEREDIPPASFFTEMWDDAGAEVDERFGESEGPEWNILEEHTVAEAMTRAVYSRSPETPVVTASDEMSRLRVHRVLVMDGEQLLGIVSTSDVTRAVGEHRLVARTYVFERRAGPDDRA